MWSFRLRGPKGNAATLEIAPEDSVQSFCDLAAKQLGLPEKTKKLTFRSGFPPRVVEYDPTDQVQKVFARNDTVVVDIADASGTAAAATRRAPSRAAKKPPTKRVQGIQTLHAPSKAKAAASTVKRKDRGEGFRLGDTLAEAETTAAAVAEAEPDPPGQPHRYKRTRSIHLSSKDDVGISLANAVSGKSNDRAAKFFRAATRTAVDYQYEMTLANARLNAALSNNFKIQSVASTRRASADDRAVDMKVTFKEGVRKWKEETVSMLHATELQAILKYVLLSGGETGKEMLKPFNMAQCSPRAMSTKAMEAKSNEEQWKLWKQQGYVDQQSKPAQGIAVDVDDSDATNPSAAATDTSVVGRANRPAKPTDKTTTQRALRDAMARAALSRFEVSAQTAGVVSAFKQQERSSQRADENPGDGGEGDEDVEPTTTVYCDACNKARILSIDEAALVDVDTDRWTCAKLVAIQRDGNCEAVDDEIEQIAGKPIGQLLLKARILTRRDLANASPTQALRYLVTPLEVSSNATVKDKLSAMIDEARLDEVNDFMSEIVGGSDLLGLLELQKLGTPADLVTTPIDLIYAAVRGDDHDEVTLAMVQSWQEQARTLVDKYAWLNEWRTL